MDNHLEDGICGADMPRHRATTAQVIPPRSVFQLINLSTPQVKDATLDSLSINKCQFDCEIR